MSLVDDRAKELENRGVFSEVRTAYLRGAHHPRDTIRQSRHKDIYVVPYMISDGYSIETLLPKALGLQGILTENIDGGRRQRIHVCHSIGTHTAISNAITDRINSTVADAGNSGNDTAVIVVAHGTKRHPGNRLQTLALTELINERCTVGETHAVFLEEPPYISDWQSLSRKPNIIVVPYLMTMGSHATKDLPGAFTSALVRGALLETMKDGHTFGPVTFEGFNIWCLPIASSCPGICDAIVDRIAHWDREHVAD